MMIRTRHAVKLCLAAILLSALPARTATSCPLCSEENEVKQEETGVNVALGFSLSVIVMLAVPASVVGSLGYALYRNQQRLSQSSGSPRRQEPTSSH